MEMINLLRYEMFTYEGEDVSGTFLFICIFVWYYATSRLKRSDQYLKTFTVNLDESRSHYTFAHAYSGHERIYIGKFPALQWIKFPLIAWVFDQNFGIASHSRGLSHSWTPQYYYLVAVIVTL